MKGIRDVIANSAEHRRLESEGWTTAYVAHGIATLAQPGDDPQEAAAERLDEERCERPDDDYPDNPEE